MATVGPPTRFSAFRYKCWKYFGLLLRLPLWAIIDLPRGNRPRPSWSWGRSILVRISQYAWEIPLRTGSLLDRDITKEVPPNECQGTKFLWVDPVPEHLIQGEVQRYAAKAHVGPCRIPAYGFGDWQDNSLMARDGEKIIMHCHGGAYVTRTAHPEDLTAGNVKGFVKFCKPTISRAISIEYRLSRSAPWPSSSPFPAALIDGLSGYYYLTKVLGFKPGNVIISGDSAGGNLVLALTRYLRDNPQIGLGLPGGLILVSPWCDIIGTYFDKPVGADVTSAKNHAASCDYLSGDFDYVHSTLQYGVRSLLGNVMTPQEARKNAYINPSSLDLDPELVATMFNNFPPTYIVYGDAEILVDEIRTLSGRMASNIGADKVVQDEVPDAIHDFTAFDFWQPDYSKAHKRIATWLSSLN